MHGTLRREGSSWRSVLLGRLGILAPGRGARRAPGRAPGPWRWPDRRARRGPAAAPAGAVADGDPVVRGERGHRDRRRAGRGFAGRAHLRPERSRRALPRQRLRRPGAQPRQTWRPRHRAWSSRPARRRARPAGQPGPPSRGRRYQLGYQVVGRWPGGFVAVITLPDDLKPGAWSLRFAFPSARVDQVWGALWQPSGNGDAGTATGSWRPLRGPDRDRAAADGLRGLQDLRGLLHGQDLRGCRTSRRSAGGLRDRHARARPAAALTGTAASAGTAIEQAGAGQRSTLPALMHEVHTFRRRGDPLTFARTTLNVRVPAARGAAVRVRHVIAEARPLAADVADGSHGIAPLGDSQLGHRPVQAGTVAEGYPTIGPSREPGANSGRGPRLAAGPSRSSAAVRRRALPGPRAGRVRRPRIYSAGMAAEVLDGETVRRWCRLSVDALAQTRAAIDALNVFPVPDADTGTNLHLTLMAAAEAVESLPAGGRAGRGLARPRPRSAARGLRELRDHRQPAPPRARRRLRGRTPLRRRGPGPGPDPRRGERPGRGRRPAEGTVLTVADAAARRRRAAARRSGGAGRRSGDCRGPPRPARRWPAPASSSTCWPRAEWSTRARPGCACSSTRWRRWSPASAPERSRCPRPGPPRPPRRERRAPREPASSGYEVTYLLEAPAGRSAAAGPARLAGRLAGHRRRRGPVERARARGRRGRGHRGGAARRAPAPDHRDLARPGGGRPAAAWSRWPTATAWPRCSARPARGSCGSGTAPARRLPR